MSCPKLRFKRDDGTDFPEWREVTIGEYCDILDRKRKPVAKKNRVAGTYPYYGATNIQGYVNDYIFDEPLVLLGEDSAPFMDFKNKAIAQLATRKYWVNNHAHCLRPHGNVAFLYYSLVHKDIREYVNNPKRPKLNQGDMVRIPVSIPCLEEQEKIANFLSSIDEVISLSEAEVQNLKLQKRVAMRKTFSQELRFKYEDGTEFPEWENKRLGDFCSLKNGYAFQSDTYTDDGIYNVLTISNVQGEKYITITDKTNKIALLPNNIKKHQILKENAILISLTGNVGRVSLNTGSNNLLNQRVGLLAVNDNSNKLYIYYCLANARFEKAMIERAKGSAQKNISKGDVEDFVVPIPCLKEQQIIADFFSAYDNAISCAEQELDKWNKIKKALLRQMFA